MMPSRTHYLVHPDGMVRCGMGHRFPPAELDQHPTRPHPGPAVTEPECPAPARAPLGQVLALVALYLMSAGTVVFAVLGLFVALVHGALLNGFMALAVVCVVGFLVAAWVLTAYEAQETRR